MVKYSSENCYIVFDNCTFFCQQKYSQPIVVTSSDDPVMIPNYLSDSLTTIRDSHLTLDEQYNGLYEEIPAMSGN